MRGKMSAGVWGLFLFLIGKSYTLPNTSLDFSRSKRKTKPENWASFSKPIKSHFPACILLFPHLCHSIWLPGAPTNGRFQLIFAVLRQIHLPVPKLNKPTKEVDSQSSRAHDKVATGRKPAGKTSACMSLSHIDLVM